MSLVLEQLHKKRKELPWTAEKALRLPLYYDGNSGCIHIGAGNKSIDELALGLPPQPNEWGQINIDPAEESDDESDSDLDEELQSEPLAASSLITSSYTNLRLNPKTVEGSDLNLFPATAPSWAPKGKEAEPLAWSELFEDLPSTAPASQCAQQSSQRIPGVKPQYSLRGQLVDPYETAWKARKARQGPGA
jgi:hypothetical protein